MIAQPAATRPDALTLPPAIRDEICRRAEASYPFECCGALIGRHGLVTEAMPLRNATEEGPRRRFKVSPEDYRTAERAAAARHGGLLGFYHSHPDHPARPSEYDLDQAWPSFRYVIVSVVDGSAQDVTCWCLRDDRGAFDEVPLSVVEPET